jgi:alpha-galactosidase
LNLLTNDEVIAINQDVLGKQARCIKKTAEYQVWMKQLSDGSHAVGVFNLTETGKRFTIASTELKVKGKKFRDLWRQVDVGGFVNGKFTMLVPSHGVKLYKVW